MTPTPITDGTAQPLTATGPVAPTTGLDISGIDANSDYMLELEVTALTAASGIPRCRIVLEDTVNAFTAALPVCEHSFEKEVQPGAPIKVTWLKSQVPSLRIGAASAKLRANVVALEGTTPSLTMKAAFHN